ncbi:MAG TPA: sulfatase-like hydrolase/transferase [Vicinamibacterales bacterium]|nr:sulfatase-like hydrolase/transferase [Vicinamibacterales bacterium]
MSREGTLPPDAVAAARAVNAPFYLAVAAFCVLSYSPFAYGQFIKPSVVPALTDFVTLSPWLDLVALLLTTLTVMPQLRGGVRGAALARVYVGGGAIVNVWMFAARPLLTLANQPRGLVYALAALSSPIWLAVLDHRATPTPEIRLTSRSRIVLAALTGGAAAWVVYAAVVPLRLSQSTGLDLSRRAIGIGLGTSLMLTLFVFAGLALAMLAASGVAAFAARPAVAEYWLFILLLAAGASLVLMLLVSASIAFTGWDAWLASASIGTTIAVVWADVAHLRRGGGGESLDRFCAPIAGSRVSAVVVLAAEPIVAYLLVDAVSHFDWNFLLQKLGVLIVWVVVFAASGALVRAATNRVAMQLAPLLAVLIAHNVVSRLESRPSADATVSPRVVLDRYVAVDPSFRLVRDAQTARSAETAEYYAYLHANTLIPSDRVRTPETPFVDSFGAAAVRRPDIYLFVIDSMRRDYLSPYNPAASFTPAIAALAADSFVFERAFTRYAGTALAVPSIWAGGMVIHTLEQPSFERRNALLHLIDADGYLRVMDRDHIIEELMPADPDAIQLDRGRTTMQFDVCRTIDELEQRVTENANRKPIFFYELPQNVHIAVASKRKVPDGESYPGFFAPVASAIHRVDGCLGSFVDFLRRTDRYDNSIIILTSDHGDSLGEEGRWGHAYFIVPEVMRIPLIVHLPSRMRDSTAADLSALAFSTDVTPSLYALLGHEPRDRGPLFGRPLFVRSDADFSWRRRQPFLLASSYGAVYARLARNGRRMYVVDAVDGRDDLFAMDGAAGEPGRALDVTPATAAAGRAFIREQIDDLARMYGHSAAYDRGAPQ